MCPLHATAHELRGVDCASSVSAACGRIGRASKRRRATPGVILIALPPRLDIRSAKPLADFTALQ
jgi:hypothetical protein